MTEEKKKKTEKPKVVKVNNEGGETDEVFIHSEEPYVNKAIYVKAGKYKVGDSVEEG
jgi:hypothetical protein